MPTAPWEADRPLDLPTVHAIVGTQFPALRPVHCRELGSGWDNEAFLVNDRWVFRFPKRREVVAYLERERALMPLVAEALDLRVPVPELHGQPCERFPYPFSAHRVIRGVPADFAEVGDEDLPAIAAAMGRTLGQLHAIPVERLEPLGLPVDGDRCDAWQRWVRKAADDFRAAMPRDVVARWEPWLRGEVPLPPGSRGPWPVVHNDLGAEHVLLDPESRRPTGILDWGDACRADPAVDFAGMHLWRGERFVDAMLEHYPLPRDDGFRERVRFVATAMALTLVMEAQRMADAAGLERWRRFFLEAFEPRE